MSDKHNYYRHKDEQQRNFVKVPSPQGRNVFTDQNAQERNAMQPVGKRVKGRPVLVQISPWHQPHDHNDKRDPKQPQYAFLYLG